MSQDLRPEHAAVNPSNAIEHVPVQQPDTEAGADARQLIVGLSVNQAAAFEALTAGASIASAARAGNVTRKTLYSWLAEGHAFAQAYEQWKQSIAETSRTRLLMIGEAATVQIAKAVRQGDTRAALAVARGMGLLAAPAVGPTLAQITAICSGFGSWLMCWLLSRGE